MQMNVYRITSVSYGSYDSARLHRQGYLITIVTAVTDHDAIDLVINEIYNRFSTNLDIMNSRFKHSCHIIHKLHGEHESEVLLMDVVLK